MFGSSATCSKPVEHDPWTKQDPWKKYHPIQPVPGTGGPSDGLQQIEDRIQNAVLAKIQPPMDQEVPERVLTILSWFWQTLHGSVDEVVWVSHFHLYADFMSSTGHPGPTHRGKWIDGAMEPHIRLQAFAYKQRTRWFVKILKESLRHHHVSLVTAYGRPYSQMLLMHTGLIALPWPKERLQYVDQWILKCCGNTLRRQTKLLESLPFIDYDCRFLPVAVSTAGL